MLEPHELTEYIDSLKSRLIKADLPDFYQAIVDEPFRDKIHSVKLDLGIIALLILDNEAGLIKRTTMSNTELAQSADAVSAKPFNEMNIPVDHESNIIAKSIKSGKTQRTSDWNDLFVPVLKADEARFNQTSGGIGSSYVAPIITNNTTGALIYDFYQPIENIDSTHEAFIEGYTDLIKEILSSKD